jgi:hypothetical protein
MYTKSILAALAATERRHDIVIPAQFVEFVISNEIAAEDVAFTVKNGVVTGCYRLSDCELSGDHWFRKLLTVDHRDIPGYVPSLGEFACQAGTRDLRDLDRILAQQISWAKTRLAKGEAVNVAAIAELRRRCVAMLEMGDLYI